MDWLSLSREVPKSIASQPDDVTILGDASIAAAGATDKLEAFKFVSKQRELPGDGRRSAECNAALRLDASALRRRGGSGLLCAGGDGALAPSAPRSSGARNGKVRSQLDLCSARYYAGWDIVARCPYQHPAKQPTTATPVVS